MTTIQQAHENKLMSLYAKLSAAVLTRGLDFSRQDDPHVFDSARKWAATPGCGFELRTSLSGADKQLKVRGVITDSNGDALVEIFTFVATASDDPIQDSCTDAT
jgi:hypothetical protein